MDNDDEKEEKEVEGEDEELELIEIVTNKTSFEEANEIIRTCGFIKGIRL